MTWLREQLHDGPKTRYQLWLDGLLEGISKDQMYRAAKRLGVIIQKKGMTWSDADWTLPEHMGTKSPTPGESVVANAEQPPKREPQQATAATSERVATVTHRWPAEIMNELRATLANETDPAARKKFLQQARRELEEVLGTSMDGQPIQMNGLEWIEGVFEASPPTA